MGWVLGVGYHCTCSEDFISVNGFYALFIALFIAFFISALGVDHRYGGNGRGDTPFD
jgi:hypothetical protein